MDMNKLVDKFFDLQNEIKEDSKQVRDKRKKLKELEQEIISHMIESNLTEYSSSANQVFIKPTLSDKQT